MLGWVIWVEGDVPDALEAGEFDGVDVGGGDFGVGEGAGELKGFGAQAGAEVEDCGGGGALTCGDEFIESADRFGGGGVLRGEERSPFLTRYSMWSDSSLLEATRKRGAWAWGIRPAAAGSGDVSGKVESSRRVMMGRMIVAEEQFGGEGFPAVEVAEVFDEYLAGWERTCGEVGDGVGAGVEEDIFGEG